MTSAGTGSSRQHPGGIPRDSLPSWRRRPVAEDRPAVGNQRGDLACRQPLVAMPGPSPLIERRADGRVIRAEPVVRLTEVLVSALAACLHRAVSLAAIVLGHWPSPSLDGRRARC